MIESLSAWAGKTAAGARTDSRRIGPRGAPARRRSDCRSPSFWDRTLERGVAEIGAASCPRRRRPAVQRRALRSDSRSKRAASADAAARSVLYPTMGMLDGRHGHNAWLHELPDPVTKVTWDNYACLSPDAAQPLGVEDGDVVRVRRPMAARRSSCLRSSSRGSTMRSSPSRSATAAPAPIASAASARPGSRRVPRPASVGVNAAGAHHDHRQRAAVLGPRRDRGKTRPQAAAGLDAGPSFARAAGQHRAASRSFRKSTLGELTAPPAAAAEAEHRGWACRGRSVARRSSDAQGTAGAWRSTSTPAPAARPASSPARRRTTCRSSVRTKCAATARCTGSGSTATTPGTDDDARGRAPADAVPALRARAVRDGLPGARHLAQRGGAERAGLQPLRRHPVLRQQLPVQGAPVQLVRLPARRSAPEPRLQSERRPSDRAA